MQNHLLKTQTWGSPLMIQDVHSITHLEYCAVTHHLSAVFKSGATLLCRLNLQYFPTNFQDANVKSQIQNLIGSFSEAFYVIRWICNPNSGSLMSKISPQSQLLAVGLENSIVAIHRLNQPYNNQQQRAIHTSNGFNNDGFQTFGLDSSSNLINNTGNFGGDVSPMQVSEPVRVLSLFDWGYSPKLTGRVVRIEWDPSGKILAVGYEQQGMVLWSASGCRLLCTLRQSRAQTQVVRYRQNESNNQLQTSSTFNSDTFMGNNSTLLQNQYSMQTESPMGTGQNVDNESIFGSLMLENGVKGMCWLNTGYHLGIVFNGLDEQIVVFEFLKHSNGQHHLQKQGQQRGFEEDICTLMGHDSIAIIKQSTPSCGSVFPKVAFHQLPQNQQTKDTTPRGSHKSDLNENENDLKLRMQFNLRGIQNEQGVIKSEDLSIQHILVPQQYIQQNWPILQINFCNETQDIAVAGRRGFSIYNHKIGRWKVFSSIVQEQSLQVFHMNWMGRIICVFGREVPSDNQGQGQGQGLNPNLNQDLAYYSSAYQASYDPWRNLELEQASRSGNTSLDKDYQVQNQNFNLWLYPRHHLNQSSVLVKQKFDRVPTGMDCLGQYILFSFQYLEIVLMKIHIKGVVNPKMQPQVTIQVVQNFSSISLQLPVQGITIVAPPQFQENYNQNSYRDGQSSRTDALTLHPNQSPYRAGSVSEYSLESKDHRSLASPYISKGITQNNPLITQYRPQDNKNRTWFEWAWGDTNLGTENQFQGSEQENEELQSLLERQQILIEFDNLSKNGIQGILEPNLCILERWGGCLSILDINTGQENMFARDIENFWLGKPLPSPIANLQNQNIAANSNITQSRSDPNLKDKQRESLASKQNQQSDKFQDQMKMNKSTDKTSNDLSFDNQILPQAKPQFTQIGSPKNLFNSFGVVDQGQSSRDLDFTQEKDSLYQPYITDRIHSYIDQSFKQSQKVENRKSNVDDSNETQQVLEIPWWGYGPQGMYLWFPSFTFSNNQPFAKVRIYLSAEETFHKKDPELEFDREVYPIGISQMIASIIGVTERMVRVRVNNQGQNLMRPLSLNPSLRPAPLEKQVSLPQNYNTLDDIVVQTPSYYPSPQIQSILACLLRRLIQKGAIQEAIALAKMHQFGTQFLGSLEWLLFSALENEKGELQKPQNKDRSLKVNKLMLNNSFKSPSMTQLALSQNPSSVSLLAHQQQNRVSSSLQACAEIVRAFPFIFPDVVVSVSRKTDPQFWPPLFNSTVSPSGILKEIVSQKRLRLAACFLVVVDHMEGTLSSQNWTLKVMNEALKLHDYDLTADLIRFLAPPELINLAIFSSLTDSLEISDNVMAAQDTNHRKTKEQVQQPVQKQQITTGNSNNSYHNNVTSASQNNSNSNQTPNSKQKQDYNLFYDNEMNGVMPSVFMGMSQLSDGAFASFRNPDFNPDYRQSLTGSVSQSPPITQDDDQQQAITSAQHTSGNTPSTNTEQSQRDYNLQQQQKAAQYQRDRLRMSQKRMQHTISNQLRNSQDPSQVQGDKFKQGQKQDILDGPPSPKGADQGEFQGQEQDNISNDNIQQKRTSWLMSFLGFGSSNNPEQSAIQKPFDVNEQKQASNQSNNSSHLSNTNANSQNDRQNDKALFTDRNKDKKLSVQIQSNNLDSPKLDPLRNGSNNKEEGNQQLEHSYSYDYQLVGALKGAIIISNYCWYLASDQQFSEIIRLHDSFPFIDHGLIKIMALTQNLFQIKGTQGSQSILKQAINSLQSIEVSILGAQQLPSKFAKPRAEDYVRSFQNLIKGFRDQFKQNAEGNQQNREGQGQGLEDEILQNARYLLKLFRRNGLSIFYVPLALMLKNVHALQDFIEKNQSRSLWEDIVQQLDRANLLSNVKDVVTLVNNVDLSNTGLKSTKSLKSDSQNQSKTPRQITFSVDQNLLQKQKSGPLYTQNSLTRYSSMGGYTDNEEFDQVANQMILSSSSSGNSINLQAEDDQ